MYTCPAALQWSSGANAGTYIAVFTVHHNDTFVVTPLGCTLSPSNQVIMFTGKHAT